MSNGQKAINLQPGDYEQEAAGPLQPIIPPAIIPFFAERIQKHFSKQ
ncbi:hypothetical protein ES703_86790 [subsurface metagenome]